MNHEAAAVVKELYFCLMLLLNHTHMQQINTGANKPGDYPNPKVPGIRVFAAGLLFFLLQLQPLPALQAADHAADVLAFDVNLRPVYYYVNTVNRDGSQQIDRTMNLRARLGMSYHIQPNLTFRGRIASRLSTNQNAFRFLLDDHTGGSGSYPPGTTTIDEFLLRWQVSPDVKLTFGRFQGRFPLAGFIPKGVDRYYAANLAISHTDGVWMEWDASDNWRLHVIGSHNNPSGSSHTARAPLRFDESAAARMTGYANLQHRHTGGRWAQREFSVSVTPQNFYRDGELKNHVAFSTRWMYRPAFSFGGEEYLIGGELGYIPLAPDPADAGLQIAEDRLLLGRSAVAWQVSAYANQVFDRHRLGVLYGQTDPHWMISSSFAPNVTMAELRYRYTIASWIHYEFRFRLRDEIHQASDARQTRQIFDFYTRVTVSI